MSSLVEVKPSPSLQLTTGPSAPPSVHSLPPRPTFDTFEGNANSLGLGTAVEEATAASALAGITGSNKDWVANRRAIRMANMSAAEMLKAEMMSAVPLKPSASRKAPAVTPVMEGTIDMDTLQANNELQVVDEKQGLPTAMNIDEPIARDEVDLTGPAVEPLNTAAHIDVEHDAKPLESLPPSEMQSSEIQETAATETTTPASAEISNDHGVKRKLDEVDDAVANPEVDEPDPEDEDNAADTSLALKVNADGTVVQEDTVKSASSVLPVILVNVFDLQVVGAWLQRAVLSPEVRSRADRY